LALESSLPEVEYPHHWPKRPDCETLRETDRTQLRPGGILDFDLISMEPMLWAMILVVGIIAGVINTIVGGGTLLILPLLIEVVEIPPHLANGTNRICVAVQAAVALWVLSRGSKKPGEANPPPILEAMPWKLAVIVGLSALPGAYLASVLEPEELRRALGLFVLVAVSVFMFSESAKTTKESPRDSSKLKPPDTRGFRGIGLVIASVGCGLYGGFVGAGIGAFIILMFTATGVELERAVRWKVFLVWLLSTVAGVYYFGVGNFSLSIAIPLVVAYALGGYLGGRLIVRGSNNWLRPLVGVISATLALLMLFGDPK